MESTHWNPYHGRDLSLPKKEIETCAEAQEYELWLQEEYKGLDYATVIQINQLKIWTTDKYFEYLAQLDKAHQTQLRKHPHRCIEPIFKEYYTRLLKQARRLKPPPLFEPLPPPPPPAIEVVEIDGPTLGEFVRR